MVTGDEIALSSNSILNPNYVNLKLNWTTAHTYIYIIHNWRAPPIIVLIISIHNQYIISKNHDFHNCNLHTYIQHQDRESRKWSVHRTVTITKGRQQSTQETDYQRFKRNKKRFETCKRPTSEYSLKLSKSWKKAASWSTRLQNLNSVWLKRSTTIPSLNYESHLAMVYFTCCN